ncbi:MAG TPA: hypothetical protein VK509_15495, partial [Polyangiales bacterium]|nr:hypothetical protein [Polyangiales bacterium]
MSLLCALLWGCGAAGGTVMKTMRAPDNLRPEEYTPAVNLYQRECSAGDATGCGYLGFMYDNGFGVDKDVGMGVELTERACGEGSAYGCAYLGYLHRL